MKKIVEQYQAGVLAGKIPACKWTRLAVERHVRDLERDDLFFDEQAAEKFLSFASKLRFTKGEKAGQGVKLEPFQMWRYWGLMGWKRADGARRFRKAYVEEARKNGKTEEAAILGLYFLLADGEAGAEVYTAATRKEQAKIVFDAVKVMTQCLRKDSVKARKMVGIHHSNIHVISTGSKLEPIASDSDKQDGLNPLLAIVDEYHAHKSSDLLEVLETGMGARVQPLTFIITTAGFNKQGPCFAFRKVCTEILSGIKTDDSVFAVIYTLDDDDDWRDSSLWGKANPNLNGIPTLCGYLDEQYLKATNEGKSKEIQFKTKNLCVWTDTSAAWINDETFMRSKSNYEPPEGSVCFGGLDLSAVSDITAFSMSFPQGDEMFTKTFFWVPAGQMQRADLPYRAWQEAGHLKATEGNMGQTVDVNQIAADILDLARKYRLERLAFDRYMAHHGIMQTLGDNLEKAVFVEMGQGYRSMSEPVKKFETMIRGGKLKHDGNPVLRWMCGNVELAFDPAGNVKLDKAKSQGKIDGMVSWVMSLAEATRPAEDVAGSVYDTRGVLEV